jgi:hypothetical protein
VALPVAFVVWVEIRIPFPADGAHNGRMSAFKLSRLRGSFLARTRPILCSQCFNWQAAVDLAGDKTGFGRLHTCIRKIPGAGARRECDEYDLDATKAGTVVDMPKRHFASR